MRHIRLTGENIRKLASFKNQIGSVLKEINKYDENEKHEAASNIQNYMNNDSKPSCSSDAKITSSEVNISEKKYRISTRNKRGRYIEPTNSTPRKKIGYKCKVCNTSEKTKKLMLKHVQTHVGAPKSCIKCRKTFNGNVSFKWHEKYYCSTSCYKWKYKCNICPRQFISKRTLESHLQGHKRNNCTYCDKVLTRRVQLVQHLLEVHSVKLERDMHKCDYCEKRYIKKSSLYYHWKQHLPEKFICLECGKVSDTPEGLDEHKKQHDQQKHFNCSKCGDKFSRRQQYLYHLKRHNQYKCVTCNESYASRLKAVRHKQQNHQVEGLNPRFICPHCPVAFHRETRLLVHMRKHTDENRIINCKYCKKTFNSPYAYYKHCITINHEKFSPEINDIACIKCGKHFAKRYDFKQHMYKVHNISKQFVSCQYCDYKTVHKNNMDRHIALHFRGENQYTCEYCGKTCDSIGSLNDHIMYNHVQTKQFKCDKCDKSFKRNSELVRHQDSHSDEKPHVCTMCDKSYKRANHLKRHETRAHQIVKDSKKIKQVTEIQGSCTPPITETCSKIVFLEPPEQANEATYTVLKDHQGQVLLTLPNGFEINEGGNVSERMPYVMPDRSWVADNEEFCKVYNDVVLNYGNTGLDGNTNYSI